MKIVAKTDIGNTRENNQDAYATGELPGGVAWAVVCDGMGGVAGGNVASTTAVKIIAEQIAGGYRPAMRGPSVHNLLESAIHAANISVYDLAKANPQLSGMGTTVVCALVIDSVAYIAHAGDSRAYVLKDGVLTQLTKDHSVVQEMVETGKITQTQAKVHPNKNLITRALGVHEEIRVDFDEKVLDDNAVLVLCTDGLSNYVEDSEICEITKNCSYNEMADALVQRALENGGGDNVTVVTLTY